MSDEGLSPKNRIRIEVDRGLCIGSGDCVDTAPEVFELDPEDKARVIDPDGAPTDLVEPLLPVGRRQLALDEWGEPGGKEREGATDPLVARRGHPRVPDSPGRHRSY